VAVVWIPPLLRDLTAGQETVSVPGATVRQLVDALDRLYPGIRDRLCDANGLKPGIAVAVGTQMARLGLAEAVPDDAEVHFLPAIAGGAPTWLP
jgi:molybdopterin synthase sulfur carrier subunit